jgi:hypothetical protein
MYREAALALFVQIARVEQHHRDASLAVVRYARASIEWTITICAAEHG